MKKLILIISLLFGSASAWAQIGEYKPYRTNGNYQVVDSAWSGRQVRIPGVTNSLNGYSALNGQSFGYNATDTTLQFYLGGTYPKMANKQWAINEFATKAGLNSFSATSPLSYNSGTGAFSIQVGSGSQNGYISSTDWNTFNGKVPTTTTVAGFALSSNVTLAALTATDGTLTFSGSYTGATARTVGINLANANTWSATQTFTPGIVLGGTNGLLNGQLVNAQYSPTATSGTYALDSYQMQVNNASASTGSFYGQYFRVGTLTGNTFSVTGIYGIGIGLNILGSGTVALGQAMNIGSPNIPNSGAVTNDYGLFIANQSVTGVGTGYAIYQAGTSDQDVFLGTVNFGSLTASSMLKLNGSHNVAVATAGTDYQAPISLTVTGSSGASTFSANTLNVPTYTAAGLGAVTTSTTVAGFALSGNVTLATLTPGSTLKNTSGSNYNGSASTTLDIDLTHANTWSGIQTLSSGIVLGSANGLLNGQLANELYSPTATSGSYALDSKELLANNAANSSASFAGQYFRVGTLTGNTFNITGSMYGVNFGFVHNGSGVLSSTVAFNIATPSMPNGGTVTTSHGLLINAQAQSGIGTAYAIYQSGTSDIVALLGTVNLGSLIASKPLFLSAGKNVTNTGPGTTSQGIAGDGSLYSLNSKPHVIFTPTTGGTVTLTNNQYNIINPSGALLALTIALPSSPSNNDCVFIKFTQNITTVTYSGGTVVDGITAPTAGGLTVLTYDSGTTSWY